MAGAVERADLELAFADAHAYSAVASLVKVRMGTQKILLFPGRQAAMPFT